MKKFFLLALVFTIVLGLGSCALFNKAPIVVIAFSDDDLWDGYDVFFDATYSSDPENDDLDMSWSVVSAPTGSTAAFDTPASPSTWFGTLVEGDYTIRVTVTDGTNTVEAEIDFYVQQLPAS